MSYFQASPSRARDSNSLRSTDEALLSGDESLLLPPPVAAREHPASPRAAMIDEAVTNSRLVRFMPLLPPSLPG